MMFAQRMWGNYGENGQNLQNTELQNQIQSLRSQMGDNQNANQLMDAIKGNDADVRALATSLGCDFNTLNMSICDVRNGISKLSGDIGFSAERVINAVATGNMGITQQLQNCCCQTQKEIMQMDSNVRLQMCEQTNTIERGQAGLLSKMNDIGYAIQNDFATQQYRNEKNTNDIIQAVDAAQRRTSDLLNSHWHDELSQKNQDLKFEISQLKQNQYLSSVINGGCTCGMNNAQ